jgi:hypothetical protein
MTRRAQDTLQGQLDRHPSAVELYLGQWPATGANTIAADLKTALDATAGLIQQVATDLAKQTNAASQVISDPSSPGPTVPAPQPPLQLLRGDGSFKFTADIVGDDIAVSNVVSTWFGGPDDPSDSGRTASGISTRDNPGLLGCALPMDGFNNAATNGSLFRGCRGKQRSESRASRPTSNEAFH